MSTVPADLKAYRQWVKRLADLPLEEKRQLPVRDFALSTRAMTCLKTAQVKTVGQLLDLGRAGVIGLPHLGKVTRDELVAMLAALKLKLQ